MNINFQMVSQIIEQQHISLYDELNEKELLGFILMDNKYMESIEELMHSDYFYFDINSKIYNIILQLLHNGRNADVKTVFYASNPNELGIQANELQKYIENLVDHAIASTSTPKELSIIIHRLYLKRKLSNVSAYIKELITDTSIDDIEQYIGDAERKIYEIANESSSKQEVIKIDSYTDSLKEKLTKARKNKKEIAGLRMDLKDLDRYLGGFQKSDLIIIAARPSMGKTALAVTMATNIAKILNRERKDGEKRGIGFFSLEMSSEQITARIVAMESNLTTKVIHTGRKGQDNEEITDGEFIDIVEAFNEIGKLPLFLDDTPSLNIALLRSRARYLKKRYDISAIFVDYLQLLRPSKSNSQGNRVLEIAEITQTLKAIAKELEIPVIALSQLSRAVEGRDDKKPQLSDLRESGTIEQDADIVMFLYREAYYMERSEKKVNDPNNQDEIMARDKWIKKYEPIKNLAELLIAKNRNGPIGSVNMFFNRETMEFSNWLSQEQNESPALNKSSNKGSFKAIAPQFDRAIDSNGNSNQANELDDDLRNIFKKDL